ncbi:MAG: filamentous hemagglutinin N-terminal domain-containing protein [Moorea sp. SIO3C2]|nr:filamentous hemagglutinin N-terminal domain-containing protein [Moorena sp. SIO3C2]
MASPIPSQWLPCALLTLISPLVTAASAVSPDSLAGQAVQVAQILPDETLGEQPSTVVNTGDQIRIEGGTSQGGNLFHSFTDFNVNGGEQVYFANPDAIETILSRVTGNNLSLIDGLLGVDGTANLFLLNPNGIAFGPNAQLDIRGSFTASTAEAIVFADNSTFSAVTPSSLLTMSVPLGVQFSEQPDIQPRAMITNQGRLKTGQDLTLAGQTLLLEGQLIAGDHLTLQAQETLTIRDTPEDAFLAQSGQDLTIQGNRVIDILTLQHLEQLPFISGENLVLISDGDISADAHFSSGGHVQFLTLNGDPGNAVSLYDPIISANGDVVLGDYTGVALKIEATGSIQAGNIRITGPDRLLKADGSGSDEDLLASSQAAILRAGVDVLNGGKPPTGMG